MLRNFAVVAACTALLAAAKAPEKPLQVVTTSEVEYSGGTIRIDNAYGEMNVEGWDEPRVVVVVTRTAFRHETPKEQEDGRAYLNRIQVTAVRAGNGDLEIRTAFPGRNRLVRMIHGLGDFNLDYRIKVPRNAKLVIHHAVGDVVMRDMAGDVDAAVKTGDILLQLAADGKYAIDAQCRLGGVYSDFEGRDRSPLLIGQKLEGGSGRTIHLRVDVGGISIQRVPGQLSAISKPPIADR